MLSPQIEEFARLLVKCVRDKAIKACDMNVRPDTTHPMARRWKSAILSSPEKLTESLVPDSVDETIFQLLRAIDEGEIRLSVRSQNGSYVELTEVGQGELAGWYLGTDGWRAMYSEQRFFDEAADLRT
jgi:hypothetical protein